MQAELVSFECSCSVIESSSTLVFLRLNFFVFSIRVLRVAGHLKLSENQRKFSIIVRSESRTFQINRITLGTLARADVLKWMMTVSNWNFLCCRVV